MIGGGMIGLEWHERRVVDTVGSDEVACQKLSSLEKHATLNSTH